MKWIASALGAAVVLAATGGPATSEAAPVEQRATGAEAGAACRTVVKKVRGKRRRVRVCTRPRPLNVSVGLDAGRATSFTLTPAGGSAVLRSANGATLTVFVPAGATAADVTVRATPITSIRGLPLRALVGGVHLEPDGLQLAQPATLTIEPPRSSTGRLFGFAYEGNGRRLTAHRVARDGGALSFAITHFSGYGAGTGTDATRAALLGPMLAQSVAIQADLSRAAQNPSALAGALDRYWTWRMAALAYGMPEIAPYMANVAASAQRTIEAASAFAELRCRDPVRRELKPSFDVFRALERAVALGMVELVRQPPNVVLERCLRFELDAEFRLTFHREARDGRDSWADDGVVEVKAEKVPIALPGRLQGSGPLTITKWDYTYSAHYENNLAPNPPVDCFGHESSASPTELFHARLDLYADWEQVRGHPDISLFVDPGDIDAKARIECPPPLQGLSGTTGVDYAGSWSAFADGLQPDGRLGVDVVPPLGHYLGGEVYATYGPETKAYELSFGNAKVSGSLTRTFTLRHVPSR